MNVLIQVGSETQLLYNSEQFNAVSTIWKYLLRFFFFLILTGVVLIVAAEVIVTSYNDSVYVDMNEVPYFKTGLLLGTAKYVRGGNENLYYNYRLKAAQKLLEENKIERILISGDNSSKYYNEPQTFKDDLLEMGVPDSVIYLDYAGFRTFDSVIRANKIFGQDSILIISQQFHNLRALFIADNNNIYAKAYSAKTVASNKDFKTKIRERFARVKALLDVYLLNTDSKYLGEQIEIK